MSIDLSGAPVDFVWATNESPLGSAPCFSARRPPAVAPISRLSRTVARTGRCASRSSPRSVAWTICARAGNWSGCCGLARASPTRPSSWAPSPTARRRRARRDGSGPPWCSSACGRRRAAARSSRASPVRASMIFRWSARFSSPFCTACFRARPPDGGLVPRGSWRGGVGGRRLGGAAAPARNVPASSARQWGACWLAGLLWRELQLDRFWAERLPASRKRTRWDQVLQVLVAYRLIEPGSEWRLHREWFGKSAMADLLEADFGLAETHKLYACHGLLLAHKDALFSHLTERWRDLFNVNFDVLLYDLTSTYFEVNASDLPEGAKRRHGYSRDKRPDCPQLVIALVVTPEGLPLAYEVLPGNTSDSKTLRTFLSKIETQYGKARRVWVMDRGVPTEAVLAEMRACDPPVQYLVGTPKGRLNRLEKHLIEKAWRKAREGVEGQLLAQDDELYVFAQSADRVAKERAMRRRQLKWLWARLGKLAAMNVKREEMLMKLGAARSKAPTAWRLVEVALDKESAALTFSLNRQKLRIARRREGRYLLRTNLTDRDPAALWQYYVQLVAVEEAFKNLKGDLAIRPIFHHDESRIEAHIFIAFLAYALQVTLTRRLHALAPGLTARRALEKFAPVQRIDDL